MHRYFIAAIVTLTVFTTGFAAAPARADSDDLAKALAGIAALAIIGKAISDRNDKDRVSHNYSYGHHNYHSHRPHAIKPRPLPPRVLRKSLPPQCIRHFETRHGKTRRVLGARCLERNYQFAHRLPRNCARRIETHRGHRWVYGARCLRERGFEIARY